MVHTSNLLLSTLALFLSCLLMFNVSEDLYKSNSCSLFWSFWMERTALEMED